MANDEMPRIVKIGATLRSPEERLNDARATTWAPTCYRIIAQAPVEDAFAAEQALHTLLAHRRLEARREFFRIPHAEVRALFAALRAIAQLTDDDSALGEPDAGICPGETGDGLGTDEGGASAIDPSLRSLRAARESRWLVAEATSQRDSETVQDRLRAWVESKYTHLPLREKDAGTKLDKLHCEYVRSGVHARPLGKIKFAQLLNAAYAGIGPHKNSTGSAHVYLLR
jgi:hypothetical protein